VRFVNDGRVLVVAETGLASHFLYCQGLGPHLASVEHGCVFGMPPRVGDVVRAATEIELAKAEAFANGTLPYKRRVGLDGKGAHNEYILSISL
jgi:hypothetical protein